MRADDDGAITIVEIIQQAIIEFLAINNIETESGFIEYQLANINRHDQCQMKLGNHAL
jgi:hypothetical protein